MKERGGGLEGDMWKGNGEDLRERQGDKGVFTLRRVEVKTSKSGVENSGQSGDAPSHRKTVSGTKNTQNKDLLFLGTDLK